MFHVGDRTICIVVAVWIVLIPLVLAIIAYCQGSSNGAITFGVFTIVGAGTAYFVYVALNETLCVTELGIKIDSILRTDEIEFENVSNVKIVRHRISVLSFPNPYIYVTSALIRDCKGKEIRVHGASPHATEIIGLIKEHVSSEKIQVET